MIRFGVVINCALHVAWQKVTIDPASVQSGAATAVGALPMAMAIAVTAKVTGSPQVPHYVRLVPVSVQKWVT